MEQRRQRSGVIIVARLLAILAALAAGVAGCSGDGDRPASIGLADGVHYQLMLSKIDGRTYSPREYGAGGLQLDVDNPAPGPRPTGVQQVLPFRSAMLWSACGRTSWQSWTLVEARMTFGDRTEFASIDRCEAAWGDALDKARQVMASGPTMRFDGTTMTFAGDGHTVAFTLESMSGPGVTTTSR